MRQTNYPLLSEALIVLKNINDNICRLEKELFNISTKISQIEQKTSFTSKHIVLLKTSEKKAKENVTKDN